MLQKELEQARKKVVKDGYDMSVGELMSLFKDGDLIVNPSFQRLYRWDLEQKTRFIESLLLGIPVPPIFVFTTESTKWELVDGLQRMSTILEFTGLLKDGENVGEPPLRLLGTKLLPSLNDCAWAESSEGAGDGLTASQQLDVKRTRIRVEILKKESDEQAKFELFQRLNTGGSELSEQEVRDCVMVMIDKTFYDWIKQLVAIDDFSKTTRLTERDTRQQRPTELALRFLAYLNVPYSKGVGVHDYLDDAAITLASNPGFDRVSAEKTFRQTFEILNAALGDGAFRKWSAPSKKFSGSFSISAFEAISVGVSKNLSALRKLSVAKRNAFVATRAKAVWSDKTFVDNSGAGVRGTERLIHLVPVVGKYFKP